MENTITDYDLDDYFRELSTKYKSREVQISRYLKNKISDNKKVVQKNIDIAISQIRDWYNRRRYIRTCCYCPNFTFQDNNEAYKVYLHGLIYNDEISRINKNNNIEIEILDDYKLIKI